MVMRILGCNISLFGFNFDEYVLICIGRAQVVGWPPIRSYRKNSFQARKAEAEGAGLLVKVSMDGAPYLRKIDLKVYKGYKELGEALENLFKCFWTLRDPCA